MRHITSLVCVNRKGAELSASLLMSYAAQNGRISIGMGIPSLQRKGVHSGSKPSAHHGPLRPLFNIGGFILVICLNIHYSEMRKAKNVGAGRHTEDDLAMRTISPCYRIKLALAG